jgi:antitoxin VapB
MALSIKNREAEANARELAILTGKPLTQALNDALIREIKCQKANGNKPPRSSILAAIKEIQERVAKLPLLDKRHPDEILYDEFGLPK